jgi:hypothetical protein
LFFYVVRKGFGVVVASPWQFYYDFLSSRNQEAPVTTTADETIEEAVSAGGGMMRAWVVCGDRVLDFFFSFIVPTDNYGVRGADRSDPEEMGFF